MATAELEPLQVPPDSERAGGTMSLLDHLLELRMRITWCAAAVVAGMFVFFVPKVGLGAIEFLLQPARSDNPAFQAQAITPLENIVVYFKVALLGGISLGMPMLVYQTLRFVTPGLTSREKRWILPVAIGASLSFVGGMAFAYFVVLPTAYAFLFKFGTDFAVPNPTISSYMDLTTRLILVVGLVFETPIFVMGLAKFRLVTAGKLLRRWRWAIVLAFVASAVLTPTPDPVTQTLVAGPIVVLYFVGIGLAWLVRPRA